MDMAIRELSVPENVELWSDHKPPELRTLGTSILMVWEGELDEAALRLVQKRRLLGTADNGPKDTTSPVRLVP